MTTKERAKQVIDTLPDDADIGQIMHALYINAKFSRGEQEIRDGKGISQEEAKRQLKKWLR